MTVLWQWDPLDPEILECRLSTAPLYVPEQPSLVQNARAKLQCQVPHMLLVPPHPQHAVSFLEARDPPLFSLKGRNNLPFPQCLVA